MEKLFSFITGVVAAIMLTVSTGAHAQNNEIFIGYGFGPDKTMPHQDLPEYSDWAISSSTDKPATATMPLENARKSGNFSVGYLHRISSFFSLGLTYSHTRVKRDYGKGYPVAASGLLKNSSNIVMVTGRISWFKWNAIHLYSRLALGVQFVTKGEKEVFGAKDELNFQPKSTTGFAYQVSALGVEWRFCKYAGIFAEGGYGLQGACLVGAKTFF